MKGSTLGFLLVAGASAAGCPQAPSAQGTAPGDHEAHRELAPSAASAVAPSPSPAPRSARAPLDGRAFPDKVLALTWDDGPDEGTLALARYLRAEGVSATFFVVGAWIEGLSSEPGQGPHVLRTGHEALPVLGDLIALGHRLGNHTLNHVLLADASPGTVAHQLRADQEALDPFLRGGIRLFRAPGGAWSASASAVVDGDPVLNRLVGPVHWDIDGKDWEGSLYCRSTRPAVECEPAAPGGRSRVKAAVTAQRYLSIADAVGHGIVLLHDRVGHVGSGYALEVARGLIPQLKARGFVFAPPVLRFSPLAARSFSPESPTGTAGEGPVLGDVDGDGKMDTCSLTIEGIACALAGGTGAPPARKWSAGADFVDSDGWARGPGTILLGDINGDGRADVCGRGRDGLACALSNGRAFLPATIWLPELGDASAGMPSGASIQLVDVNGDGRADVCLRRPESVVCGLAP